MVPPVSVPIFDSVPEAAAPEVVLPKRDVRRALDLAVLRGWSENTRRAIRVCALLVSDTLAGLVGVAAVIATWRLVDNGGLRPIPDTIPLVAMVLCIQPLALSLTGAYGSGTARVSLERVAAGLVIAALVGWLQARLFGRLTPNLPDKTAYLYSAMLITILAWCGRVVLDYTCRLGFRLGVLQRRVLLVGHRDEVEDVQRKIDHDASSDIRVVGALSPRHLGNGMTPLEVAMASCRADSVVVATTIPHETLQTLIACCSTNGVGVSLLPRTVQALGSAHFELTATNLGLLLHVRALRFGLPQLAVKRTMDVVLTCLGLALTWPFFVLIAAAIKLDSRGPVLYSHERVGVGGRTFRMLKFRTMHAGADALKGQLAHLNASGDPRLFKILNDPRITRVGRLLRRTSLDELPQVFNVLKGEMSLVGPRPFFRHDLAAYDAHHFERLHVLPGITGLWQVSGRSDIVDFEEVVRLDQQYIRNWSIGSDLAILIRTIPAAFGRGAF